MELIRTICLAGIFIVALSGINAQEELSLSRAIEIGLENNYQVRIAEKDLSIARNSNDWGIAGKYPTVNLSLNSNNGYTNINNPASFLRKSSSVSTGITPGVDASFIIFDGYRIKFNKRQLEEIEKFSEGNVQVAVENTIQGIILSYQASLILVEQLKTLEEVLDLSRDRIAYEEARREFGQAGKFDLLQTQDAYLNDSTSYLALLTSYENSLRNLKLAIGDDDPASNYVLTDTLEFNPQNL